MSEPLTFRALRTEEEGQSFSTRVIERTLDELPDGDLLIRVDASSLNFKDALSASGNRGVTRNYPHTPGIDAAGEVVESNTDTFPPGCRVIVTGYDLGMNTDGGLAEFIRVPANWAVKMPSELTAESAMSMGTAGLTAALCIDKLQRNGLPEKGARIAVTGASGGVGSLAVMQLAMLGHEVVAVSGKADQAEWLTSLGAAEVVGREYLESSSKPLLKPQLDAAIDTVGGEPLAELLKQIKPEGSVACCGLAAGTDLPTSVFPFILRGVSLLGVDSVEIPQDRKAEMWQSIARHWPLGQLSQVTKTVSLGEVPEILEAFLKSSVHGRYLVKL